MANTSPPPSLSLSFSLSLFLVKFSQYVWLQAHAKYLTSGTHTAHLGIAIGGNFGYCWLALLGSVILCCSGRGRGVIGGVSKMLACFDVSIDVDAAVVVVVDAV